jgi:phosphocarrier protein HPr
VSLHDSDQADPEWREASATVNGAHGLHARPAIRFSRAARGYAARIQVCAAGEAGDHGPWVDAKSVAKVMGLQVETGRTILLRAAGADADAALGGLRELVEVALAAEDEEAG